MLQRKKLNKGYEKGWADAQEHLAKKFEKEILKAKLDSYDKGYQAGANQMSNDPCLCGFWGKSHSNKIVSDWYDDCENGK